MGLPGRGLGFPMWAWALFNTTCGRRGWKRNFSFCHPDRNAGSRALPEVREARAGTFAPIGWNLPLTLQHLSCVAIFPLEKAPSQRLCQQGA